MEIRYRIMTVLTDSQVQAFDIDGSGNAKPVSVNGNVAMSYKDARDMDAFIQHIKDNYSIEEFSDDGFAVLIVNCDADAEVAERLHTLTAVAADSSLIRAEYVLPFIAAGKCKLKKDAALTVSIAETAYTIYTDTAGRAVCVQAGETDAGGAAGESGEAGTEPLLVIEPADFAVLFSADAGMLGNDEEALKQKDAQIAELQADTAHRLAGLRSEYEQELELEKTAQESAEYQRQLEEVRDAVQNMRLKRSICWVKEYAQYAKTQDDKYRSHVFGGGWGLESVDSTNGQYRWEIQMLSKDGDLVVKGSPIAELTQYKGKATVKYEANYIIKAPQAGRIFYLEKDAANIKENTPIAIIGSEDDTRSDAVAWYALVRDAVNDAVKMNGKKRT